MRNKAIHKSLSILLSLAMMLSMPQTAVLALPAQQGDRLENVLIADFTAAAYKDSVAEQSFTTSNGRVEVAFTATPTYGNGTDDWYKSYDVLTVTVDKAAGAVGDFTIDKCKFNGDAVVDETAPFSIKIDHIDMEDFSLYEGGAEISTHSTTGLRTIEVYGSVTPTHTAFSDDLVIKENDTIVVNENTCMTADYVSPSHANFTAGYLYTLIRGYLTETHPYPEDYDYVEYVFEPNSNGDYYGFVSPTMKIVFSRDWKVTEKSDGLLAEQGQSRSFDSPQEEYVTTYSFSTHEKEINRVDANAPAQNGSVKLNNNEYDRIIDVEAGETVTLNVTPDSGYKVKDISAKYVEIQGVSELGDMLGKDEEHDRYYSNQDNHEDGGYFYATVDGIYYHNVVSGQTMLSLSADADLDKSQSVNGIYSAAGKYYDGGNEYDVTWVFYTNGDEIEKIVILQNDGGELYKQDISFTRGHIFNQTYAELDLTTVTADSEYTFVMPAVNVFVRAEFKESKNAITSTETNVCSVVKTVGGSPVEKAEAGEVVTFTVNPNTGYKVMSAYVVQDPERDYSGTPTQGLTYDNIVSLFGDTKYYHEGVNIGETTMYLGYVDAGEKSGLWLTDAIRVNEQESIVRWNADCDFNESVQGVYLLTKEDGEYTTHTLNITVYDNKIVGIDFWTTESRIQSLAGTYEPERPLVSTTSGENGSYTFTTPDAPVKILPQISKNGFFIDPNGGSIGHAPQGVIVFYPVDMVATIRESLSTDIAKEGYTLLGLYEKDDQNELKTEPYNFSTLTSETLLPNDITLYAKWQENGPQEYAINTTDYAKNGSVTATVGSDSATSAVGGTTVTITATPSTGYETVGMMVREAVDESSEPTTNVSDFLDMRDNIVGGTIYYLNGYESDDDNCIVARFDTNTGYPTSISVLHDGVRVVDFNNDDVTWDASNAANGIYKALTTLGGTIEFHVRNGELVKMIYTATQGSSSSKYNGVYTKAMPNVELTKNTDDGTWSFVMPAANVNVYPEFEALGIIIDPNGGVLEGVYTEPQKISVAELIDNWDNASEVITREGYTLVGLYEKDEQGNLNEDPFSLDLLPENLTENIRLYAKWAPKSYTIAVQEDITGGTVLSSVDSSIAGEEVTLTVVPDYGYTVADNSVKAVSAAYYQIAGTPSEPMTFAEVEAAIKENFEAGKQNMAQFMVVPDLTEEKFTKMAVYTATDCNTFAEYESFNSYILSQGAEVLNRETLENSKWILVNRMDSANIMVLYDASCVYVDAVQDASNPTKFTFEMPNYNTVIFAEFEQLHWVASEYHNLSSPTELGDIEFSVEGDTQHKAGDAVTATIDYSNSDNAVFDHATMRLRGLRSGNMDAIIEATDSMFEFDHIEGALIETGVSGKTAVFGVMDGSNFLEKLRITTEYDGEYWSYSPIYTDGFEEYTPTSDAWTYLKEEEGIIYFKAADTTFSNFEVDSATNENSVTISFTMPDSDVMVDYYSRYAGPCTVTFDSNGGSEVATQENIENGGFATRPETDPVNNGLRFYGWFLNPMSVDDLYRYDEESGNIVLNSFDFANTRITNNITLTALWRATLTVDAYGGNIEVTDIEETPVFDSEHPIQYSYKSFAVGMDGNFKLAAFVDEMNDGDAFTKWIDADTGETYSTNQAITIEDLQSNLHLTAVFGHKHNWDVKVNGASMTAQCIDHDGDCSFNNALYTATLTANGGMYNGSPFAATLTLSNEETSPLTYDIDTAIKYIGRDGTVYAESTTAPSAVGKYTATATIVDYDDESYTISKDFEIRQYVAPVRDDDDGGSSGGGGSSSSNNTVTVSVSSDSASVNVSASVSGTTATVKAPTTAELDKIISSTTHTGEVEINVSGLGKEIKTATIPTETVKAVEKAANDTSNDATGLTVTLTEGSVTFDAPALTAISEQAKGNTIQLNLDGISESRMTVAQRETARNMQVQAVYDAYLTSNGSRISDFHGGKATVTIPYTLKEGQNRNGVLVWYIADNGDKAEMPTSYDGKVVSFTTTHFSNYVVVYDAERAAACPQDATCPIYKFVDADASAWYHDGVHWTLDKGVMNGVSPKYFNPNGDTSRAMVVTMLWRMEGSPAYVGMSEFTDVDNEQWYGQAVRWADAEGIVEGYTQNGNKVFNPDGTVAREQLATILYRYAQYKKQNVSVGEDTNIFSYDDAFSVSTWAMAAMQWACGSGIINGIGSELVPAGNASRAQVATMLMRYSTK